MRIAQPLSMGEFLRRHAELLMTRVVYWHGDVNRDEVARLLRDLRFVSETYGLVIPASMSRRALADLAILVSLWVCADRGVDPMFGATGADVRAASASAGRTGARTAAGIESESAPRFAGLSMALRLRPMDPMRALVVVAALAGCSRSTSGTSPS